MRKAIVALLIFAACGGDGGWDDQARRDFIAGCVDGGATQSLCECLQEKTEARFPDMTEDDQIEPDVAAELAQECAE